VSSKGKKAEVFPKSHRVRKRREFLEIQGSGSRLTLPSCIVLLYPRLDNNPARLGITVTRKFGNAVARNRAKRLLREVFRRSPELFPSGIDLVVIPKSPGVEPDGRPRSWAALRGEWEKASRLVASRAAALRRTLAETSATAHTGPQRGPRR